MTEETLVVSVQASEQSLPGGAALGLHVVQQLSVGGQQEEEHEGAAGGDHQPVQQHPALREGRQVLLR